MKPKIVIILTEDGIDTVTVLSKNGKARREGYTLCSLIADEINDFDLAVLRKLQLEAYRGKQREAN